nr:hypothetical protein [Nostoc sp. ChiSLP01]
MGKCGECGECGERELMLPHPPTPPTPPTLTVCPMPHAQHQLTLGNSLLRQKLL